MLNFKILKAERSFQKQPTIFLNHKKGVGPIRKKEVRRRLASLKLLVTLEMWDLDSNHHERQIFITSP